MILSSLGLKKSRLPVAKLVLIVESTLLAISLVWIFIRKIPVFENIRFDKGSIILGILMGGVVLASSGLFYLIDKYAFNLKMRTIIEKMIYPIFSKVSFPEIIMMAVMSGIAEELFFRGILMKEFGIIAASLIFGALHTSSRDTWFMGFWSALAGVFFCILYIKTGNLLVPIIAHAVNNFVGVMYIRYVYTQPQQETTPVLTDEEEAQEIRKENRTGDEEMPSDDVMSISPVLYEESFQDASELMENLENYKIMPVVEETPVTEIKSENRPEQATPSLAAEESLQTVPLPTPSSPVQLLNPDMVKDIIPQSESGADNSPKNITDEKEGESPVFESLFNKKENSLKDKDGSEAYTESKKKKKKKSSIKPDRRADDTNEEGIGFVEKPQ